MLSGQARRSPWSRVAGVLLAGVGGLAILMGGSAFGGTDEPLRLLFISLPAALLGGLALGASDALERRSARPLVTGVVIASALVLALGWLFGAVSNGRIHVGG